MRTGYLFDGWWTEPKAGAQIYWNTRVTAMKAHTQHAHWKLLKDGIIVAFNANGGTGTMPPLTIESGKVYKLPRCTLRPPNDRLHFAGWACSNGRRYDDEMLVFGLGDVTMTAIWE